MAAPRKKTMLCLDPQRVSAVRGLAASTGRPDYEIVEDALQRYLASIDSETARQSLRDLLDDLSPRSDLDDDEALALAYTELAAARRARQQG